MYSDKSASINLERMGIHSGEKVENWRDLSFTLHFLSCVLEQILRRSSNVFPQAFTSPIDFLPLQVNTC
jgi:hypothetical protein